MIDYTGRYLELADYLTGEGYIFAGHNHLGHGKSAGSKEDFGFFGEENGAEFVLKDMYLMNKYLRHTFPTLPLYLLGHSMGSFISRLYVLEHPHTVSGLIIHGTGGPNPLVSFGKVLAKAVRGIYGARHRSRLIKGLAFGSYNDRFDKSEGEWAWLTRDTDRIKDRDTDEYTSFIFTTQGYIDLFGFISRSNSKQWFMNYPKNLPTLIISGDMDPVGNYGKGPREIYKRLMIAGCTALNIKSYEGARHELFNETNREEVFRDLVKWLNGAR
jgi:alpha-beta hydrolase superfamily lysophospholipase